MSAPIVATAPLTPKEAAELSRLESAIEHGLRTFFDVGTALQRIRDGRLYRAGHKTFEAYCEARWDLSRPHAYRQIEAAEVVQVVSPIGDKWPRPANEYQARQLVGLDPPQQVECWRRAVSTAPKGKVTAAHIARVVEEVTGRPPGALPGEVSEEVAEGWTALPVDQQMALLAGDTPATEDEDEDDGGDQWQRVKAGGDQWQRVKAGADKSLRAAAKWLTAAGPEGERAMERVEEAARMWEEDAAGQGDAA